MSPRALSAARHALVTAAFASAFAGAACRSKKPDGAQASAAAPSSSAAAPAAQRCHELGRGLVVGTPGGRAKTPSDDDGDLELPFATAVGSAVALSNTFAVSGISTRDGRSEAFVAFVPGDGKPGRTVFLGAVHGDPDPPLLVAEGERVLVAVENSDAAGRTIELRRLAPAGSEPERGPELTGVGDEGMGLAAGDAAGLVVWSAGKGDEATLRTATVSRATPATLGPVTEIAGTGDAESPIVRSRPGGHWLAWIAERAASDAGTRDAAAFAEETSPLEATPRVLTVTLLDAGGRPSGTPRPVSAPGSHVVAFDAVILPDGALALAWREDDAAPGVESGGLELARVAADGAVTRGRAADEAFGAGAPVLVRESAPEARTWLLVPGEDDRLRIALLAPNAISTTPFAADDTLRGAEILAAAPGKRCGTTSCVRFLLARTRNRAVELSVAECRP